MSVVVKSSRAPHKPSAATAVLVSLGFIVVIFFLVTYGQQLLLEHDLKSRAESQRMANSALRDENVRLSAALLYFQSDKYVEQRAREDLNLRRPEEELIIPVQITTATESGEPQLAESATPVDGAPATESGQPNWEKWLNLFSPGN